MVTEPETVKAWDLALCSEWGATTNTSWPWERRDFSRVRIPSLMNPSSLVMRIRIQHLTARGELRGTKGLIDERKPNILSYSSSFRAYRLEARPSTTARKEPAMPTPMEPSPRT